MGILGQLWDMTSQISAQILGQSSLKSMLSLINGNCVYPPPMCACLPMHADTAFGVFAFAMLLLPPALD